MSKGALGYTKYMCRGCVNGYPGPHNVYNLHEFGAHLDKTHRLYKNGFDEYIVRWYGRLL
ncbi:hypothetical protein FocTR4_00011757 [Fusarium oxysporum f. sp. cubense]|uniref:Uncharacterized protein n=1 Tax=Fusarium oxysporum f. sp. cubense TaxID=61366 RepID=A0A5C6SGI0_FUSOC|nr:hypothetical protein FocTR4_00011757 [Fusarium oxysporum f. sp. cubense]